MFKVCFLKESKGMHKVIKLISNFLYDKNIGPFYENTCSLDELDEKPNQTKISKP
jgi:hypothetical protein